MAFMSQENKKRIAELVKPILKKYGIKASLAVDNYSSLVCNIKAGKIDFIENYCQGIEANYRMRDEHKRDEVNYTRTRRSIQVNHYHVRNTFSGDAADFLVELRNAMMDGNHDNSRIEIDHHDVGWYVNINIGRWNKPYVVEA